MGMDYLSCKSCNKCINMDRFPQCKLCYEHLNCCDNCYNKNKNNFAEYKNIDYGDGLIVCDKCIENYEGLEELKHIDFKEFKTNKMKLHKALNKSKLKYFSNDIKISKITEEIKLHENAIENLKLLLK